MPVTSSWNPTSRVSRVKALVVAAGAALTLSFGLQAANPEPASAMKASVATCNDLYIIAKDFYDRGYDDAFMEMNALYESLCTP